MDAAKIAKTLAEHQKKRFAFRNAESGDLFDCTCGKRYTSLPEHQADELVKVSTERGRTMTEIKAGDRVVLTEAVPESTVYSWVKPGTEGVVDFIHGRGDYPYAVKFDGTFWMKSGAVRGSEVTDPVLLFKRDELELKEQT